MSIYHAIVALPGALMDNHTSDGYESKQYYKNDGDIKDQALYAAACLKDRASAAAAKDAAQASTTRL